MTNEQRQEATAIIARVAHLQTQLKLSDRHLVTRYPELGSAKTWRSRLLENDFSGLRPDRILASLRQLSATLDGGTPVLQFFDDLPFVRQCNARLELLASQRNDRRVFVILAPTGVGKSAWARNAVEQNRAERVYVRLRPSWREKKVHICGAIARALGEIPSTSGEADAESKCIDLLKANPRTVFLDEAHEGGVALMKLVRTFVDETQARFVYLAYPTEFERVRSATVGSIVEAQQFIGRCLKPVFSDYGDGTSVKDVAVFLRRTTNLESAATAVAGDLVPFLSRGGNLRLLDDAIGELNASEEDWSGAELLACVRALSGVKSPARKGDE